MECGGGVVETKEHNSRFEQSPVSDEGHLPLVPIFDAYVVVTPSNVKFSEVFGISEFVNEVRNEGKGIGISDGVFV